jgi:hypothetical protein
MHRTINRTLLLGCALAVAALTGCQKEVLVKVPVKEYITVKEYRPLPDSLLSIPQITYPKERTPFEAVRALNFNTSELQQCIANMQGIVKLQPQK